MKIFTLILFILFSFNSWLFDKLSDSDFNQTETAATECLQENLMNIWYVNASSTGGNTGTNWGDAFTDLQQALNAAGENDEIWVAQGDYFPSKDTTGGDDPSSVLDFTFSVKEGVRLYGGFIGGETTLDDRNPFTNSTVLNGTLPTGETVKTVFRFIPEPFNTNNPVDFSQDELLIDGFQIMNSSTLDTVTQNPVGGITFYTNYRDKLTVQNCLFLNHQHISKGGGICAFGAETGLAQLTVFNCTFVDNRSKEMGGGLYAGNCGLDVSESNFQDNTAGSINSPEAFDHLGGGAIAFESGSFWSNISFNIEKTDFFSNSVGFPALVGNFNTFGGGAVYAQSVNSSMSIDSCLFAQNFTGFGDGGALFLDLGKGSVGQGGFQLSNTDFFSNNASWNGGAIHIPSSTVGDLRFHNNHFNTNSANAAGGAMYVSSSNFFDGISIDSSDFISNGSQGAGGAVYAPSGENLTFTGCLFQGNSTLGDGGAIASSSPGVGDVILNNCEFTGNSCTGLGGAVFNSAETVIARGTLFDQNRASGISARGGAVYSKGLEVINCIFSKNEAWPFGSALFAEGSSTIANCTFYNNFPGSQIYFAFLANLENCIVWTTTGEPSVQLSNPDLFVSVNNNIIHGGFAGNNNKNISPRFIDPDSGDFHLSVCSPGVNSGNNAFIEAFADIDFDGEDRIFGGTVDMGAFENHESLGEENHYFVRAGSDGDDDNLGIAWDCAFSTLEKAFEVAVENDTIWVAKGVYTPQEDVTGNSNPAEIRQKTFFPQKNFKIYGGFAGNEDHETFNLDDRNFVENETILSGLLDTTGGGIFTHHILFTENLTDSTLIDGFTLSDAHAEGGGIQNSGGAIFSVNSSPVIQNCVFKDNLAQADGAAIAVLGNKGPIVRKCTFMNNVSLGDDGGAVYSESKPQFIDCEFLNNSSFDKGGVIRMISTDTVPVVFKNCRFSGNQGNQGGAIYNSGNLILENCIFENNSAFDEGGAIYNEGDLQIRNGLIINSNAPTGGALYHEVDETFSFLSMLNCTFAGNSAGENNAIIHLDDEGNEVIIANSIIWGNNGVSITFESDEDFTFTHNLVENGCNENGIAGCGGTEIFDGNPAFADPGGGDFSLREESIAINAGINSAVTQANLLRDLNNISRIVDGTVDLGAYEFCDPALGHDCDAITSNKNYFIENQEVLLFPNPVNSRLNIKFEKPLLQSAEIELINVTGQILKRHSLQKSAFQYQIDLTSIQPGYYFIRIESENFLMTRGIMISR